jgi:hypothetical protein
MMQSPLGTKGHNMEKMNEEICNKLGCFKGFQKNCKSPCIGYLKARISELEAQPSDLQKVKDYCAKNKAIPTACLNCNIKGDCSLSPMNWNIPAILEVVGK